MMATLSQARWQRGARASPGRPTRRRPSRPPERTYAIVRAVGVLGVINLLANVGIARIASIPGDGSEHVRLLREAGSLRDGMLAALRNTRSWS
jgi:hypothetical protein